MWKGKTLEIYFVVIDLALGYLHVVILLLITRPVPKCLMYLFRGRKDGTRARTNRGESKDESSPQVPLNFGVALKEVVRLRCTRSYLSWRQRWDQALQATIKASDIHCAKFSSSTVSSITVVRNCYHTDTRNMSLTLGHHLLKLSIYYKVSPYDSRLNYPTKKTK